MFSRHLGFWTVVGYVSESITVEAQEWEFQLEAQSLSHVLGCFRVRAVLGQMTDLRASQALSLRIFPASRSDLQGLDEGLSDSLLPLH